MKNFLIYLLLLSSWARAEEPGSQAYVDEPVACLSQKKMPCAIRIIQKSYRLDFAGAMIDGEDGSSFVLLDQKSIRLLSGNLFIETEQDLKVEAGTVFAILKGESLFQKSEKVGVTMTNFSGDLKVSGVFQKLEESIPMGLTKWYAGANQKGELEQGVFTPADPRKVLPLWRNLTVYPRALAKEKVNQYKKLWKAGVEISAEFYKEIVDHRLAADDEKRLKREKQAQHEKEERLKLRQLFRERNNLN